MGTQTTLAERTQSTTDVTGPSAWPTVWMLCRREVVRFLRQRNRVVGAIGQPLIFWLLFGAGLRQTFQLPAGDQLAAGDGTTASQAAPSFQEYYFPGTIMLILLFTAIFATISIIEDRREGFLQSVLVAPVPRWAVVLGKVFGGTILAVAQGILFLVLGLILSVRVEPANLPAVVLLLVASAVGMTSLGMVIAWRMQSTQGFHAIMSLVLMPMWLLSGAFFPVPRLGPDANALQYGLYGVMQANPLTYAVAGLRQLLQPDFDVTSLGVPSLPVCWLVTILFSVVAFAAAWAVAGRRFRGDSL